jgi:DNA ligase-4
VSLKKIVSCPAILISLLRISQCSLLSDASDDDTRHLALVFFDILVLDSVPLLSHPYSVRRTLLESVVERIPGRAMLADRVPIELNRGAGEEAEKSLRRIFADRIADHQEGIVIKSDEGMYNDRREPWVKVRKVFCL